MYVKKNAVAGLREALVKLDSFIGATIEPGSTSCATFSPGPFAPSSFTEGQRRAIRAYVESWIREPLAAALASIDGERDWTNEVYLSSLEPDAEPRRIGERSER